jgi:hypothetical protein
LDTPGIQPYIFGSNRLRENIGASELVRCALGRWPLEILKELGKSNVAHPNSKDPAQRLDNALCIEDDNLDAEVVYVGGGNIVTLFRQDALAHDFVTQLNRKILQEAPGLGLAAAHVPIDWEKDGLSEKVDEAMEQLATHKQTQAYTTPLLGLGVTVACQSTGLVATRHNTTGDPYPISDAVAAKLEMVEPARHRLLNIFADDIKRAKYDLPLDFDEFGRSEGEMSYIAVVHADGNRMGQFFRNVGDEARGTREYIQKMRHASVRVEQAGMEALSQTVRALLDAICHNDKGECVVGGKVVMEGSKLPFRPLVFGGDDVTFVCDGRLGLTLAARYLEAFEEECEKRELNLYACAGVAVVKAHYPFARAYQLSEALAKKAKEYVREEIDRDSAASALDWHFAASGLMGSIKEIRDREYTVTLDDDDNGLLHLRPLPLADTNWRAWPRFVQAVETFKCKEPWRDSHNKLMALREILRQGPDATRTFLRLFNLPLPVLDPGNSALQETGWYGHEMCGYFDAIEALDFYVPLRGVKNGDL